MKGSTVDAMSDAVDNAELMLSCISLAYKGACLYEEIICVVELLTGLLLLWQRAQTAVSNCNTDTSRTWQ